ncbi:uncharacterized protein RB166_000511 [Leptodactylus fuscus]
MALVRRSLGESTWRSYGRIWAEWELLTRELYGGRSPSDWEDAVLFFVGSAFSSGVSPGGLANQLAALAFWFKFKGYRDFTKSFLVRQAVKGFRRGSRTRDTRRPLSFQILGDLLGVLGRVCNSDYEVRLFGLAFSLAFFGAFRISELVSPSRGRPGGLGFSDCWLSGGDLVCRIRRSKTDQLGRGLLVRLCPLSGSPVCPVRCFEAFVQVRPAGGLSLLLHADSSCLSRFQFVQVLRRGLQALGLPSGEYSSHSFRIGAATEAARWGLPPGVIKRIGRWESDRFKIYIRPQLL